MRIYKATFQYKQNNAATLTVNVEAANLSDAISRAENLVFHSLVYDGTEWVCTGAVLVEC